MWSNHLVVLGEHTLPEMSLLILTEDNTLMEQTTDCVTASSVNMLKNKVDTSQEDGLHVDENCWTLDKPMASLSTCHLSLWLG